MAENGSMLITWLGHSCFKVESQGYAVVIDPYEDGYVPGLAPLREQANHVLCSHKHGDHNYRAAVTVTEKEPSPFRITALSTYHDDRKGELRGEQYRPYPGRRLPAGGAFWRFGLQAERGAGRASYGA